MDTALHIFSTILFKIILTKGGVFLIGIIIALWLLNRRPSEYDTKPVPVEFKRRRGLYSAGVVALLYIWPVYPLVSSSMYWPFGVFVGFIVTIYFILFLHGSSSKKDWSFHEAQEDLRINDPELYAEQQEEKRKERKKKALIRMARGGIAFYAGYKAGKKTEL